MARTWLAPALGALLVACTSSSPKGGAPVAERLARTTSIVRQLSGFSVLSDHVGRGGRLELRDGGYALARTPHFDRSSLGALKAILPTRADAPLRLSDTARADFTLELAAEGVAQVAGDAHEGALVFADALADVDLVQIAEPGRIEEVRILRSPKAAPEARWRVKKGAGVAALRVRDDIVEALDVEGRARLHTEPAFAVDARGTRRPVAFTLEGDVLVARFDAKDLAYPVALDPVWINGLGVLPNTSFRDTPWVVLPSGNVVAFQGGQLAPPALLDPTTEKWTLNTTSIRTNQYGLMVPLGTGKFLAGLGEGRSTADLWTNATGAVATGSTSVARSVFGWVQIDKGTASEKVIVYAGSTGWGSGIGAAYSTAEAYDVATGTWSVRPNALPGPRYRHAAVYLGDRTALIAGGTDGGGWSNLAFLHDVDSDAYTALPNMPVAKAEYLPIALSTGNALLVGGTSGAYAGAATVVLYNRATKTFSSAPAMKYTRQDSTAIAYGTGKWLVMGGFGKLVGSTGSDTYLSTTEIYDEATNTWTDGPTMNFGRSRFGAARLADGRIVVGGGLLASGTSADKVEYLVPDKQTCSSGSECASGFCSEGYCCNRACTGQCEACDSPGREGVCMSLSGEAPRAGKPTCGTYVQCVAGVCATSCTADSACTATTSYCTSGSVCAPKKVNGAGCTFGNECTSGNCVDGVCCNTTCTGQCYACSETGSVGTCTAVDGAPRGTRTACTAPYACSAGACATGCTKDAECASTSYCDTASNTCKPKLAAGTACTANSNCTTGFCVDGYCCNSACTGTCLACNVSGKLGTCSNVPVGVAPSTGKSCAPFNTCNGAGACSSSCTLDAQCTTGSYCLGSTCVARKTNGNACGSNLECVSGFCAAGVCCDTACTGECESCGTGTCSPKAATSLCGIAGCVGNYLVPKGKCSGTGNVCQPQPATACAGSLKCANATTCLSTCATDADCVSGTCSGGACVATFDAGVDTSVPDTFVPDTFVPDTFVPDTTVADTTVEDTFVPDTFVPDTFVPDTFVPDTAVDDTGTFAETPAPKLADKPEIAAEFKRCTKGSECPSGFCVEGVCCDSACGDRCHSCALLTNPGKCTLEPIGVDLKSECGPALSCLGTCGDKGECVGSGTGTMCARNRCTGPSTGVGPAYCGGPGAKCPTDDATQFDCSPYVCEPAFGACRTLCITSNDCAQGFTCDTASKSCIPIPPPPEVDDSGCAVSTPGVSRGGLGALGLLLGLGLFARRRR